MSFERIRAAMQACGLRAGEPALLGFSGGPDSSALLHALHAAGWPLLAAHLDHGLRRESAAEAQQAAGMAAALGVPFFSARAEVAVLARKKRTSIEEAAREARYAFLFRVAQQQGAAAVAVAHTADDQAETILMHLLRGAGPAGLRGMPPRWLPNPWSASVPLLRPMLAVSRAEVLAYCREHGLAPLQDASNQDPAYFRNRLRAELLPLMEGYAPGFTRRLLQTGELVRQDLELVEGLADAAWRRCLAQRGPGYVGLQRAALLAEPPALQRALLRRAAAQLRAGGRDIGYALIEAAQAAAAAGDGRRRDWFGGLFILTEGETVWLAQRGAQLPAAWPQAPLAPVYIEAPGELNLGGWRLSFTESPTPAQPDANADRYQAWLDFDRSGAELTLRRPRPGERMRPLGLGGSQKLSDLFVNAKLPQRARAGWPLLCKGDEIVWAPGLRLADAYRVRAGTRRALHAQLVKL